MNDIIGPCSVSSFQNDKALDCESNGSQVIKFLPNLTSNGRVSNSPSRHPSSIIVLGCRDGESSTGPHPTSSYIYNKKRLLLGFWDNNSFFKTKCLGVRD